MKKTFAAVAAIALSGCLVSPDLEALRLQAELHGQINRDAWTEMDASRIADAVGTPDAFDGVKLAAIDSGIPAATLMYACETVEPASAVIMFGRPQFIWPEETVQVRVQLPGEPGFRGPFRFDPTDQGSMVMRFENHDVGMAGAIRNADKGFTIIVRDVEYRFAPDTAGVIDDVIADCNSKAV